MSESDKDNIKNPLKVGQEYILFFGNGNPYNRQIEIRGIVDDHVIVRSRRSDGSWEYGFESLLEAHINCGSAVPVPKPLLSPPSPD
jgi:hypothetical protein